MLTASWKYVDRVQTIGTRLPEMPAFPYSLPFVRTLDLSFTSPVTFFVGENGSGKSTLLEAIAVLCRLPVFGGGRSDLAAQIGPDHDSPLSRALRPNFRRHPRDGYFFRADFQAQFASLLDERDADPDFLGDPYAHYGGRSLHTRSHGEAFLEVIQNRVGNGLYLFDEPESALSPQRQLTLLASMHQRTSTGQSQFIVATHSPMLLTFPGATIVSFDDPTLPTVDLRETSHYQITRRMLESPDRYWKHLRDAT